MRPEGAAPARDVDWRWLALAYIFLQVAAVHILQAWAPETDLVRLARATMTATGTGLSLYLLGESYLLRREAEA